MSAIFQQHYVGATVLVVFALSGCQLPSGKWSLGLNKQGKSNVRAGTASKGLADRGANSSRTGKPNEPVDELIKKGDILRKNRQYEEAGLVYQRALTLTPQNPNIHHRLAIIADKQQQFSVADKHYDAALKIQPNNVNLLSDLGYSYSRRGNPEKAEKILKKGLTIDATHKGAMANLGSIYAQQNRFSEAQALFRAGTTEAEAQQYLSQLFPDRPLPEATAAARRGRTIMKGLIDSPPQGVESDLSQLSNEELQAEVERRKSAENPGRSFVASDDEHNLEAEPMAQTAQVSWDAQEDPAANSEETDAKPQGVPVPSSESRQTGKPRKTDSPVRTTRAPSGIVSADLVSSAPGRGATNPHSSSPRSSRQRATEFGLNAGPGNLFSIVPGIEVTDVNHEKPAATSPPSLMEDSSKIDLTEGESLDPVAEAATDWDQTVTHRPATIATTETPPVVPAVNGSGNAKPYEGLWPNSNQLPNQRIGEAASNPRTNERLEVPRNNSRTASRLTFRRKWSDTAVDEDKANLDATPGSPLDPASSEDAADSWPYASQR